MRIIAKLMAVCLFVAAFSRPVLATEQLDQTDQAEQTAQTEASEVELLREKVERMTRFIEVQNKALLSLEKRMRLLEKGPQQPAIPAQTPPTAADEPTTPREPVAVPQPQSQPQPSTEQPVKKEAEVKRALQDVTEQEQGFFGKQFTVEHALTYTRFDRSEIALSGFLALDAIFLGTISVDEVESDIITSEWTGRAGITDDLQVTATVPFVYRHSNFISGGAGGASTALIEEDVHSANLGDIGFGISYRAIDEREYVPDVVVSLAARAPTGKEPFGIEAVEVPGSSGSLTVPDELPTGSGVWQASAGVSVLKTYDPAILFASFDYFYNFERSFDDLGSAAGDQPGKVDIGDSYQFGLGIGFALNEILSLSLSYTQRFIDESRTKPDGSGWTEVVGSDANVAKLNVGVTFGITDDLTMITNLATGLTQDAADVEAQLRFAYSFGIF